MNDMTQETYKGSETVTVDRGTVEFLEEAEKWVEEAAARKEEIRAANTNQALFEQGARDFLEGKSSTAFLENSDAYFQGHDYGRRISNDIKKVATQRFPSPSDTDRVREFAEALLKKQVEAEKL